MLTNTSNRSVDHFQQPKMARGKVTASTECLASIIIPNYNHARYIGDAIQSVLNQVYRDFEIIVVDDGSTDDSREAIARFGGQVRAIWQENRGLSAARNTGIRAARGSYIGLLDADDMYEPDFLSTLVPMLESDPDAVGVYCGYRFVDHLNRSLPQVEARQIPDGQLYRSLVDSNFLVPESMLVRRQCYEGSGFFDETLRACEDWDMWLRLSSQYKIIGTTEVLTRHRILPGSMSSDPIRMLDNRLAVLGKHFGPESNNAAEDGGLKRQAYGRAYLASSVEYLQYGDKERAYECFQRMAEVCPEMLAQLDTFYQLGCGDQPKGSLGNFASLDLQRNAQVLEDMLGRLFAGREAKPESRRLRRTAYANAYLALGLLSYGSRQFGAARHFLRSVLKTDPRYGFERRFMVTWLKASLDPRVIEQMKARRQKIMRQLFD